MYGQNAIVVNEFLGNSWNHVISGTRNFWNDLFSVEKLGDLNLFAFQLQFLPNATKPLGVQILESRGFFTHAYWYWIGIGALVGFVFLFNILFAVALSYLNREFQSSHFIPWVKFHILIHFSQIWLINLDDCLAFEKTNATISEESKGPDISNDETQEGIDLPQIGNWSHLYHLAWSLTAAQGVRFVFIAYLEYRY